MAHIFVARASRHGTLDPAQYSPGMFSAIWQVLDLILEPLGIRKLSTVERVAGCDYRLGTSLTNAAHRER
jgi:hypothetical protein